MNDMIGMDKDWKTDTLTKMYRESPWNQYSIQISLEFVRSIQEMIDTDYSLWIHGQAGMEFEI